jgi:hypothetical protein
MPQQALEHSDAAVSWVLCFAELRPAQRSMADDAQPKDSARQCTFSMPVRTQEQPQQNARQQAKMLESSSGSVRAQLQQPAAAALDAAGK